MEREDKLKLDWEKIKNANDLLQTKELKGKQYAEVKERVIAFRRVHPLGQIITEPTFTNNFVNFEAVVFDGDGVMLAKGHAREHLGSEFAIEKAETSAIGRALGFCGYGISTSIASAEEIENVDSKVVFDEPPHAELVDEFLRSSTKQEQIDFQNFLHIVDVDKIPSYLLVAVIRYLHE